MIIDINADIIKIVVISIVINNVLIIEATELSSEDDKLFTLNEDVDDINIYEEPSPYAVKKTLLRTKNEEQEEDIKALLEEKYKFRNDETSTRFKVAHEEKSDFPGMLKLIIYSSSDKMTHTSVEIQVRKKNQLLQELN